MWLLLHDSDFISIKCILQLPRWVAHLLLMERSATQVPGFLPCQLVPYMHFICVVEPWIGVKIQTFYTFTKTWFKHHWQRNGKSEYISIWEHRNFYICYIYLYSLSGYLNLKWCFSRLKIDESPSNRFVLSNNVIFLYPTSHGNSNIRHFSKHSLNACH